MEGGCLRVILGWGGMVVGLGEGGVGGDEGEIGLRGRSFLILVIRLLRSVFSEAWFKIILESREVVVCLITPSFLGLAW
jgi:hypothetical protein